MNRYAATIRCSINGIQDKDISLIYFEHKCNDLTPVEAAAIIQSNTNSAIYGSGKKYHIIVTDLRKINHAK
jgi:hypothetical protein